MSEAEIAAAVRLAAEEARLVVEPSGALSVAAMRFRAREAGLAELDGPIVGVVSGGNVDPDRYVAYLGVADPAGGVAQRLSTARANDAQDRVHRLVSRADAAVRVVRSSTTGAALHTGSGWRAGMGANSGVR